MILCGNAELWQECISFDRVNERQAPLLLYRIPPILRRNHPLHFLRAPFAAMVLALGCVAVLPGIGNAQFVTFNQFAGAQVQGNDGLITLWKGQPPPVGDNGLSFPGETFITVAVDQGSGLKYYSNNPNGGFIGGVNHPIDQHLDFPQPSSTKIKDTIQTIWKEQGFDIVQKVWPVLFNNSGVIVMSILIVNHGQTDIPAQAEMLLDNENSTASTANDEPYIFTNNGYIANTTCWQTCPPATIPSFDLTFQNAPSAANVATVGLGYFDDTYTPSPLGLTPPTLVQFGFWPEQQNYTWGPAPTSSNFADNATLIMGPGSDAGAFNPGVHDSVTEIFRTAFGTPEWCMDHGKLVGLAMFPEHIVWDPASMTYSPNPFPVQTFLFSDDVGGAAGTTIRQTVGSPIVITTPKPVGAQNTQIQNIGSIGVSSVAQTHWMDSVEILPSGCSGPFQVGINFDVNSSNLSAPIFTNSPWGCSITVDCAHPDVTPPKFKNSYAGCDSVENDTTLAHDDTLYDQGLKNITFTSTDLTPAQYSVTILPPPPYATCIDTSAKIFVHQIDSLHAGHVIFTLTDCANNVSYDTICFTAHPQVPDRTAPLFWLDSAVADCHAQCRELTVTDSATIATSIDRGVDSIVIVSSTNMTLSGVPAAGKFIPSVPAVTFHVCVTDSMQDGKIILRANDTTHNFSFDTISYCTTPDTHGPIITVSAFDPTDSSWPVQVSDSQAWDRGVDSVWLTSATNLVTIPSPLLYPVGCKPTYDFRVKVVDTSQCASGMLFARDCANPHNISGPIPVNFTKGTVPVITASKTTLCSTADSAVLDAGPGFSAYLWSNGATTQKVTVGQGKYTVTVQEGANCSTTSLFVQIFLNPATPAITPPGPLAVCAPGTEKLDAGAGFTSYQWMNGGVNIPGQTSQTFIASTTGTYSVQVSNGTCSGTSAPVTVTINPLPPVPTITAVGNVMTATSTVPVVSYQWLRNGTTINGATSQSYTDLTGGSYTVTITDANGCQSTSVPFTNSGTTVIAVKSMVFAQESNQLLIPISVQSTQGGVVTTPLGFTVKIAFNKTLLIPNGAPAGGSTGTITETKDSLIVTYSGTGTPTAGTVLLNLPFTAALGDDSCTLVTIDSFAWSVPNITVTDSNGNFCLTNLCYQGGTRLIDPTGKVSISSPVPNPAYTTIQIHYELIERGRTTLIMYDLLGHEVLRMVDADLVPGTYTVGADVSGLPVGTYVYSLRTPSIVRSDHLQISR